MELSVTYIWLLAGVLMLVAEALGVTGVGLIFAGLGCLSVGIMLDFGHIADDATLMQFVLFFMTTAVWTLILWKPMRKFYSSKNAAGYNNMVGETAYAGSNGLSKGAIGEATWSGTIMKATLSEDASQSRVDAGSQVTIVAVKGATLIVKPIL